MKLNKDSDFAPMCEICEYSFKLEMTGEFLCRYKDILKNTFPENNCKHFSLDLLLIKPHIRKPIELDFAKI